jgi:hypothetical protein
MHKYKVGDFVYMIAIDKNHTVSDKLVFGKKGKIVLLRPGRDTENWYEIEFSAPYKKHKDLMKEWQLTDNITSLERIVYGIPDETIP